MPSNKPRDLNAILQQAIDLYHAGRIAAAADLLRSASTRFSSSAKLWGYLGFLQKQSGSLSDAVTSFQKATRISPSSEPASLGLFFTLWRSGKSRQAFDEMVRYIRFGEPKEYLELLRQLLIDRKPRLRDRTLVMPVVKPTSAQSRRRAS